MSEPINGLLAIDAGNTRIKWGWHDGSQWFLRGAFDTAMAGTAEAFSHLPANAPARVIVSNVAGAAVAEAIKDRLYARYEREAPIDFIRARASQCHVESRYQPADVLGADRWAALIAARAALGATPDPCLVVMAGTALTADALSADGVFIGGIIVPGLALMRHSLARGTAQLPAAQGDYVDFPRNTRDAIVSGTVEALAGAVQRMHAHLSAHAGAPARCIAAGGAIHALVPHLPFPAAVNENLVLDGLLEIARDGNLN